MSHIAEIELDVTDLETLAEAAARVGLELALGQRTYRWFGQSVGDYPLPHGFTVDDLGRCEHALRVPEPHPRGAPPYEIGVVRRRDERPGYLLLWDSWLGGYGLEARVGKECVTLRQQYAAAMTRREAARQGFAIHEQSAEDGSILFQLVR